MKYQQYENSNTIKKDSKSKKDSIKSNKDIKFIDKESLLFESDDENSSTDTLQNIIKILLKDLPIKS